MIFINAALSFLCFFGSGISGQYLPQLFMKYAKEEMRNEERVGLRSLFGTVLTAETNYDSWIEKHYNFVLYM